MKSKTIYVCNECDLEMQETTLSFKNGKETEDKSLACTKCGKWVFIPNGKNIS